jgi:phosphate/sulfate permease
MLLAISTGLLFLIPTSSVALGVIAYLLAALGPSTCMAWDSVAQRKGMKSANFSPSRGVSKAMQITSLFGIAVATIHILRISETAAELLTELMGLA